MSTDIAIDIDRALDSALNDAGEALQLRQRALGDADLRAALRGLVDGPPATAAECAPEDAARRAAAHFILGHDKDVPAYARQAATHRSLYVAGLSALYLSSLVEAEELLARCIEIEPRDEQARLALAALQAILGRGDDAKTTLGENTRQTDRPQVLYVLGTIAECEGEYAEAHKRYQEALALDPDHVDSLFRMAYQHDLSGDDDAAIALYERARRTKPTRVNVLVNLGVLYEDRGDYRKAVDAYRSVLDVYPNHPRARRFVRDAESSQSMVLDEDTERNEDRRNQLLVTPISDFELSVRSRNCLAKMSIRTLGDLIQRTEAELLSYKNFGETSLQEIKDILDAKNLRLGMRRDEVLSAAEEMPTLPEIPNDSERSEALATPVADLDLSVRSSKCMTGLGLNTLGDIVQHSEQELLRMKNFGITSLQEIKTKIAKHGLNLRKQ